jgi:hypothetical protein
MARKIGSKEDRINRFFRMCLEWQYDRRHKVFKNNSYYFTKYQVGKYNSRYFKDIDTAVIDREYIINKMKEESGLDGIKVVATGGLGKLISDATDAIDIYDPELTLHGLRIIHDKQR